MNLLNMSFSATVLILIILIIRVLLLHKLPKGTFLVLWYVTLCRLLLPFEVSSRFSIYTVINLLKDRLFKTDSAFTEIPVMPDNTVITGTITTMSEAKVTTIPAFMIIWLVGLAVCALFFLVTHLRCRIEYKTSLPIDNALVRLWQQEHPMRRSVQIRQSDRIITPLTYGIFRPVVLLPKQTDWSDETRLYYILAHEFVHIRRFDTLTKLIMATALCVHWFNPFVWLMYVLLNQDIELSCDEAVVKAFGWNVKSSYALTLIGLEEKKNHFSPLINNFSKNAIEERIVSIMKSKKTTLLGILIAFVIVVGTVIVFATNAENSGANSDGSINPAGRLTGIEQSSQNDFEARDISALLNPVQTEAISSDETNNNHSDTTTSTQDGNVTNSYSFEGMMTPDELAQLYSVYEPFGLIYDKEKDCFYYNGKLVQSFTDILSSNGESLESGKFSGSLRQFGIDGKGEVNIKALRDYTKLNVDGEGELIGIEVVK